MRYLKYLALVGVLMLPMAYSQAQDSVGVEYGPDYGDVGGPPVCDYGYYNSYPYACAPYGYYGPGWFTGGVFIGAGPWYGWGGGWRAAVGAVDEVLTVDEALTVDGAARWTGLLTVDGALTVDEASTVDGLQGRTGLQRRTELQRVPRFGWRL